MLTRTSLAGVCSDPSKTEKKTFPYVEITSGQTTRADIPGHEHRDFDVDVYGSTTLSVVTELGSRSVR